MKLYKNVNHAVNLNNDCPVLCPLVQQLQRFFCNLEIGLQFFKDL